MSPVEILKRCILEKQQELEQLQMALKILEPVIKSTPVEPSVAPPTAPLQSVVAEETAQPAPTAKQEVAPEPPRPQYTGPRCGACGNKMYQTYRTMPSGAMVSLLKCNDSACGNEAYQ